MYTECRLLIGRLHRYKPDVGAPDSFADRFGVVVVILASLTVRFDEFDRNDADLVPEFLELARPVMSTTAGFETDQAGRALSDERQQFVSTQRLAQQDFTVFV